MARSNKNFEPKKEALIQLALDLFVTNGYENTTITQIMKAAGLSKGGMYHYFSSKEEILDEVIQYAMTQELAKTKETLDALPVDEKLICFARSSDSLGDFTRKLLQYKDSNKDSIVAYRVREYNIHLCIPILQEILEEGVAAGIYDVPYPQEMAEFCVLMVKAIVETNLLPPTDKAGQLRRMEAFMYLMNCSLRPSAEHAEKLKQIFASELDLLKEWNVQ